MGAKGSGSRDRFGATARWLRRVVRRDGRSLRSDRLSPGSEDTLDRRSFLGALPGAAVVAGGWPGRGRAGAEGCASGTGRRSGEEGRAGGEAPGRGHGAQAEGRDPDATDARAGGAAPQVPDAIGVQLYTVRSVMAEDPDGTLAALARIGYREVELAGLYGMSAREMKDRLDAAGLAATSSHQSLEEVRGSWEATLEAAVALGQRLVVVPSIPVAERGGEALRRIADDFNRAGEVARAAGLRFGYHNHDWEMRPAADGVRPIDLLLDRTDPELVDWQMDIFWTVHGGADPMAELDARAGRVTSVHAKDRTAAGEMVDVGAGVIDFRSVLARAGRQGLLHQYVEHDQPGDPIASVRASYRALAAFAGAARGRSSGSAA